MKRIILFVLLFAALKVAGQTTGYFRFDTVRIMKQNGTAELYIINKTKDTLGLLTNVGSGLTRFVRPRKINDSTFIIGNDTISLKGGVGSATTRLSVTKGTADSLQLDNDSVVNDAPNLPYVYKIDTFNRRGYYEDKYVIAKKYSELKGLRSLDTAHIYRLVTNGITLDYVLKYGDASTVDDTVVTVVTNAGQRLRLVVPDNIYDVRWFGAKCDGTTDDTKAVRDALRAIIKYSSDNGGTLRLINNRFDPTDLVYPLGHLKILLNGDIELITEWLLQGNISIIGESGTNQAVQFSRGPKASIITEDSDTDKAVLHCVGSGGYFENFNIVHPPGTGIWVDGWSPQSGQFACSNKEFWNIGILSNNTAASVPVRIEHAIWIYFNNCVFPCLDEAQYAVKCEIVQATMPGYKLDLAGTGLIWFRGGVLAEKGFYIGGSANMGSAVGNIHISDFIMEVPDSAMFVLDSRVTAVENVFITNPECADGIHYPILNRGNATSKVTVGGLFTIGGQDGVCTGDPITDLKITGQPEFAFDAIPQDPIFREFRQTKSEINAINSNKGWVGEIFKNPYGTVLQTNPTDTTTGYRDPSGNHTAYRTTATYRMFDNTVDIDSGDYVFAGGWVRSESDSTIKSSDVSALVVALNNATFEMGGSAFMNINSRLSAFEEQGWTLMYDIKRINSATGTVTMNYELRPDAGNPLLLWKPWLMIIKDSLTTPAEIYAWAKEAIGNIEMHVPKGSRGIGNVGNFYIGDSTHWNWQTRKWYQDTDIPYGAGDDKALVTKEYVDGVTGGISLAAIGSTPNANAATLSGTVLNLEPASASFGGVVTTGTQVFAGNKEFNGSVAVINASPHSGAVLSVDVSGNNALDIFSGDNAAINFRRASASNFGILSFLDVATRTHYLGTFNDGTYRITRDATGNDIVIASGSNVLIGTTTDNGAKFQVNGDATVADDAYDATAWNESPEVPTKNAIRDKIESLTTGITSINSQTGSTQTISGNQGLSVSSSSDVHTISLATTLESFLSDVNNTGTSETDLFSHTLSANRLTLNGHTARFVVTGTTNDASATNMIQGYFAGNIIYNSGAEAISATGGWRIEMEVTRTSSTTARASVRFEMDNATINGPVQYTALTSLDFTTTNIFKVTATAGGAGGGSNDITATVGKVTFIP